MNYFKPTRIRLWRNKRPCRDDGAGSREVVSAGLTHRVLRIQMTANPLERYM